MGGVTFAAVKLWGKFDWQNVRSKSILKTLSPLLDACGACDSSVEVLPRARGGVETRRVESATSAGPG